MRGFIYVLLVGSLTLESSRCAAISIQDESGSPTVTKPGGARKSVDQIRPGVHTNHVDHADGEQDKAEDDLAELREQLVALIDALLSQTPTSPGRSRRSPTTVGTFSEYFGSLNSGTYGNCTCKGDPGPTGPQGIPGRDGRDGRDAPPAHHDTQTQPCQTEPTHPENPSQATSTSVPSSRSSGSGVYVRWGRTVCKEGSELVYEGVIGGSHYTHTGGGSNLLCLPLDPIYDLVHPGSQSEALIYGTEMETSVMTDQEWKDLHDQGPPCAVCLAPQRPTILMVPARNVCPSSWTLEYKGQLMAGHHAHKRSEYICVDRHPETISRTATNANGALLYLVEVACANANSLPCGPYINGNELTCAVCSM